MITCPKCGNMDRSMMERLPMQTPAYLCLVCSKEFIVRILEESKGTPEEAGYGHGV